MPTIKHIRLGFVLRWSSSPSNVLYTPRPNFSAVVVQTLLRLPNMWRQLPWSAPVAFRLLYPFVRAPTMSGEIPVLQRKVVAHHLSLRGVCDRVVTVGVVPARSCKRHCTFHTNGS
jgi:hypothetical protein